MSGTDPIAIDVAFLLGQSAVLACLAFLPLAVIASISPRRRWALPLALVCVPVGWLALSLLLHRELHGTRGALPTEPSQVGPSMFAVWDMLGVLAVTWWIPVGAAYLLVRQVLVRRRLAPGRISIVGCFLLYSLAATGWTWTWLYVGGWWHEDTFVAPGFSWSGWSRVREGMSRADVEALLGDPISAAWKPQFAADQGADCWVANRSAGYFAAVWFVDDRVARKQFWYSD